MRASARCMPYRNPSSEGAGALVGGARSQATASWWARLIMTGDRILEQGRHQECVRQMFSVVGRERAITDAWPHAPRCKRARSLRSAAMMEVCATSSPASTCRFLASFSRQPEGLLEADWVARKRSINFPSFIRSSWSGNALIARQARFQRIRPILSGFLEKPYHRCRFIVSIFGPMDRTQQQPVLHPTAVSKPGTSDASKVREKCLCAPVSKRSALQRPSLTAVPLWPGSSQKRVE